MGQSKPWFKSMRQDCFSTRPVEEHCWNKRTERECRNRVRTTLCPLLRAVMRPVEKQGVCVLFRTVHDHDKTPPGTGLTVSPTDRCRLLGAIKMRVIPCRWYSVTAWRCSWVTASMAGQIDGPWNPDLRVTPTLDRAPRWELCLLRWTNSPAGAWITVIGP